MNKRKRNKILVIIAIVILVILVLLRNFIMKKNKQYNSLDDFSNSKEVIEYMGGKYIKEKESTEENFYLDIYVELKDLYTGDTSNKDYYDELISIMSYTLKFENFRIIDQKNENLIAVICNKDVPNVSAIYINGYYNYYEREESKKQYNEMKEVATTKFNIEAPELIQLINGNWNKSVIDVSNAQEFNKYLYLEDGIAIRNVYKKVFNIVFRRDYSNNVLNGININTSLDEIIQILGEPTFGSKEDGLIGYKGTNLYAFFSQGVISIYRVEEYETEELLNILKKYNQDGDEKKFVSEMTSLWPDYNTYSYDTEFVNLIYSLKGIKIQYNVTNKHGLIVGNNYKGSIEELKKLKEELNFEEIYFENEDFVYEAEIERKNDIRG